MNNAQYEATSEHARQDRLEGLCFAEEPQVVEELDALLEVKSMPSGIGGSSPTRGLFNDNNPEYFPARPSFPTALPGGTYTLKYNPQVGFYLSRHADLKVPARIYGKQADERILRVHDARVAKNQSTGVWLNGEKGSGKTLLAAILSQGLRKKGIPTVLIQEAYRGSDFNDVIDHLGKACIIFDEFEKVYAKNDEQEALLTLLSGTGSSQHLFILTTNASGNVVGPLQNRPERIRYWINYEGVSEEVVREYVGENMVQKDQWEPMVQALKKVSNCNFDIVQAAVEEHNLIGGKVEDVLAIMNIRKEFKITYACEFTGTAMQSLFSGGNDDDDRDGDSPRQEQASTQVACSSTSRVKLSDDLEDLTDPEYHIMLPLRVTGGRESTCYYLYPAEGQVTHHTDGSFTVISQDPLCQGILTCRPTYAYSTYSQRF